jgi:hypothetical protein
LDVQKISCKIDGTGSGACHDFNISGVETLDSASTSLVDDYYSQTTN